jgi:hypothetical protein
VTGSLNWNALLVSNICKKTVNPMRPS